MRIFSALLLVLISFGALGPANAADLRKFLQKDPQYAMLHPPKADRIVVLKRDRRLVLMRGESVLRVYDIALGRYPKGHKLRQGDSKTPEGSYEIDYRLDADQSKFYRALHISYPNNTDKARAASRGENPGGQIMIHGLPWDWTARQLGHPRLDWTQGCIAVTNKEIDEIWQMVDDGTRIDIHP